MKLKLPVQTGYNYFENTRKESLGYFRLVPDTLLTPIWVCLGLHNFVYCAEEKLANILNMEKVGISHLPEVLGHRYLHHPEAARKGDHALQYHICVIMQRANVESAGSFSYSSSLWHKVLLPWL